MYKLHRPICDPVEVGPSAREIRSRHIPVLMPSSFEIRNQSLLVNREMRVCTILALFCLVIIADASRRTDAIVECPKLMSRELGRRFPAIIPAKSTQCFTFNSEDMLSFGLVKVMLATNSAIEMYVGINEKWVGATLNRADQNSQELEAHVTPGDINADKNNTLTVAIRNVDDVAIPFSMVAILPLPTCDYEKITLDQDTSVRCSYHRCNDQPFMCPILYVPYQVSCRGLHLCVTVSLRRDVTCICQAESTQLLHCAGGIECGIPSQNWKTTLDDATRNDALCCILGTSP